VAVETFDGGVILVGEFWTSRQRQASRLHEISYRACFKPQLPRFFIHHFTQPGDRVYDPFSGRGTTAVEAALTGRRPAANDVNPLSEILTRPRLAPPRLDHVTRRLGQIPIDPEATADLDLSMFYHPRTEAELVSLKNYLNEQKDNGREDGVDAWIRMVATNRLTGHSPGFFSVYTLPPNQAASPRRQRLINERRGQTPPYRDVKTLIQKKSKALLAGLTDQQRRNLSRSEPVVTSHPAHHTPDLEDHSVRLIVTSPPFLNVVQYAVDNWLRCWFNDLPADQIARRITDTGSVKVWKAVMSRAFEEFFRIVVPGGHVAFEVGEVRKKGLNLDEIVVPLGREAGFSCPAVLINQQKFTKTANIWGVDNNQRGTNTNRVVLFRKDESL
jgi:hypothetical protein